MILLAQAFPITNSLIITATIVCMMVVAAGVCMAASSALAMALQDYRYAIGTASSVFGFFYYLIISLATLGMGWLHNNTLLPMPSYFLSISILMMISFKVLIQKQSIVL